MLNKIMIIGRLTKDPEFIEDLGENKAKVCKYTVACDRGYKSSGADFFNVETWNKRAEIDHKYLSKGMLVYVEGQLHIRFYGPEGDKKMAVSIKAENVKFLESKSKGPNEDPKNFIPSHKQGKKQDDGIDESLINDDDLPF